MRADNGAHQGSKPTSDGHDAIFNLLFENLVAEDVADIDAPHVVVAIDDLGIYISGPFPDAVSAVCALEDQRRVHLECDLPAQDLRVAPLLAPFCPHTDPDHTR